MITTASSRPPARAQTPDAATAAPEELRRVAWAWPTLALFAASTAVALGGWLDVLAATYFGSERVVSDAAVVVALTIAYYSIFTPAHDASHQAVSRHKWVNAVVGRLSALVLFGTFPAFRFLHLKHHKTTNEADDPDHYVARGGRVVRLLRWATLDYSYWVHILRPDVWRLQSRRAQIEIVATGALMVVALGALLLTGAWTAFFLAYFIPSRIAVMMLAVGFDFLPHYPYAVTARENRFEATGTILGGPVITLIFWCQNYHLVHHLYPAVPFYRMPRVWARRHEALEAQGARVLRLGDVLRWPRRRRAGQIPA